MVNVQSVNGLKAQAVRRFEVVFASPVQADEFKLVPGVSDVTALGNALRYHVTGSPTPFLKTILQHHVVSLIAPEPSLEDVFLSYYQTKEAA